jgi:hypothetical protein
MPLSGKEKGFYKIFVGEEFWVKIDEVEHNRLTAKLEEMKEAM